MCDLNQTMKLTLMVCTFLSLQCYCEVIVSDSVGAVLELMSLTTKACENAEFCTLISNNDATNHSGVAKSCCKPCSCEKDCAIERTCCPDFKLGQALGGTKYETLNAVVSALAETGLEKTTDAFDFDAEDDSDLEEEFEDVETQCQSASVRSGPFSPANNRLFQMISTCSDPNTNPDKIALCKDPDKTSTKARLWNFNPVQSLASGRIYSNIYCFNCSQESTTEFEPWDIYLTSHTLFREILRNVISSLNDILMQILVTQNSDYAIEFHQSHKQKDLRQAISCESVTVRSCSSVSATRLLTEACEKFESPLYTYINGNADVFNNIACISCNGFDIQEVMGTCSQHRDSGKGHLFSGRFQIKIGNLSSASGASSRKPDDTSKTTQMTCTAGEIYDKQQVWESVFYHMTSLRTV